MAYYLIMCNQKDKLTLSSWNIKGGLSDPQRARKITEAVVDADCDIILLPDAWHEDSEFSRYLGEERRLLVSPQEFYEVGYNFYATVYDDGTRPDDNYANYALVALVKRGKSIRANPVLLGHRPGFKFDCRLGNKSISAIGVYLSDQSSKMRLRQVNDLIDLSGNNSPTVLIGDMNELYRKSRLARSMQSSLFKAVARLIHLENDMLTRLNEMADSAAITQLEAFGFCDADHEHRGTMPQNMPVLQLDRVLTRGVITSDVRHYNHKGLSDHKRIEADIFS